MIVAQPKINIVQSGIKGAVSFGIKNEGLAHIFNVLRNQLYSDKILAVLREYSCNAVDAHTEAGHPEKPIRVTLPTSLSPSLKIRDFGLGLTDQDIKEIYAFYGESTKRNSNSLIGQLGLGSKSAFAYGDNFVINSYSNGTLSTYNAFIDESQVGQIAKLASKPTSEPNGVEIVIPVRSGDISEFEHKAKSLFGYFKVKPTIVGAKIDFEKRDTELSGNGWRFIKGRGEATAVMGNIGYRIDSRALKFNKDDSNEKFSEKLTEHHYYGVLNAMHLEIDLNIGDVDIAASRESLQYTDRTIKNIKNTLDRVRVEMLQQVTDTCNNSESEYKARVIIGDLRSHSSPYSLLNYDKNPLPKYKGKTIDPSITLSAQQQENFKRYEARKGWSGGGQMIKGGKLKEIYNQLIQVNSKIVLVDNAKGRVGGIVNRIFPFLREEKEVIIFNFKSQSEKDTFLKTNGITDADFHNLETLPSVALPNSRKLVGSTGGKTATQIAKHAESVFQLNDNIQTYARAKSDNWTAVSVVNDDQNAKEYAWVSIHKFLPQCRNNTELSLSSLTNINHLVNLIVVKNKLNPNDYKFPKVIGVKPDSLPKFKNGKIKHFADFILDLMKKLDQVTGVSQDSRVYDALLELEAFSKVLNKFTGCVFNNEPIPNFIKIASNIKKHQNSLKGKDFRSVNQLLETLKRCWQVERKDYCRPANDAALLVRRQVNALIQNLPLAKYVDIYNYSSYSPEERNALIDYMQFKDKDLAGVIG